MPIAYYLLFIILIILLFIVVYQYNDKLSKRAQEKFRKIQVIVKPQREKICGFLSNTNSLKAFGVGKLNNYGFAFSSDYKLKYFPEQKMGDIVPPGLLAECSAVVIDPNAKLWQLIFFCNKTREVVFYNFSLNKITKKLPYKYIFEDLDEAVVGIDAVAEYSVSMTPSIILFDETTGAFFVYNVAEGNIEFSGNTRQKWPVIPDTCKIGGAVAITNVNYMNERPLMLINEEMDKYFIFDMIQQNVYDANILELDKALLI